MVRKVQVAAGESLKASPNGIRAANPVFLVLFNADGQDREALFSAMRHVAREALRAAAAEHILVNGFRDSLEAA